MELRSPEAVGLVLKVLEEAAELVQAVKDCDKGGAWGRRNRALDKAMNVYQSLDNLLAGEFSGDEIAGAQGRCVERNRDRGRYGRG